MYDLIATGCLLLDLNLPGMSGLDLLQKLRRTESPPPVIVMSGSADVQTVAMSFEHGVCDFLEKPIDPETLLSCIRKARSTRTPAAAGPPFRRSPSAAIKASSSMTIETC